MLLEERIHYIVPVRAERKFTVLFLECITNVHLIMRDGLPMSEVELTIPGYITSMIVSMLDKGKFIHAAKVLMALGWEGSQAFCVLKQYKKGHYFGDSDPSHDTRVYITREGKHMADGGHSVWA